MPEDCIFCKIIKKEAKANIVYEDSSTIAFLDASPASKGHCLVMPKHHYESLVEVPEPIMLWIARALRKVSDATKRATKAEAFNVLLNDGKVAGQVVRHLHFHVIPRFRDDFLFIERWKPSSYAKDEADILAESIRRNIRY